MSYHNGLATMRAASRCYQSRFEHRLKYIHYQPSEIPSPSIRHSLAFFSICRYRIPCPSSHDKSRDYSPLPGSIDLRGRLNAVLQRVRYAKEHATRGKEMWFLGSPSLRLPTYVFFDPFSFPRLNQRGKAFSGETSNATDLTSVSV